MKSPKMSFIQKKKIASEKGILSELDPKQDSGFSVNLQISDFKLENWCCLACGYSFLKCETHLF